MRRALAIVLVVICGVLAGFFGEHWWNRQRFNPSPSFFSPNAPANPANPATPAAPTSTEKPPTPIPQDLPAVTMPDLSGRPHSLRDYLGHPLVVNFWATWCPPCRREMPLLQQLWTQYRSQGVVVVGIAVDTRQAVQDYLKHTHVDYPLMVGEAEGTAAVSKFGIQPVLPFSVFADGKGRIIAVKIGELHRDEANYIIQADEAVTAGRETVSQARAAIDTQLRKFAVERARRDAASPPAAPQPAGAGHTS